MELTQRKAFSFLRSFYEAAKRIPNKEDQADFLMAVCNYGLNGETSIYLMGVPAAMFELVKPNLDVAFAKAEAGARGGKANRKQAKSKTEANASKPEAIKDKGLRIKDKGLKEKQEKEKPPRKGYGTYKNVLLSDEDLDKWQTERPADWDSRIEDMSLYCQQNHKSYTDYLAALRNWARKDDKKQENAPIRKNDALSGYQRTLELLGVTEGE